jgi:hypothetical protein
MPVVHNTPALYGDNLSAAVQINTAGDFVYTTLPNLATPADDSFTYSITDW